MLCLSQFGHVLTVSLSLKANLQLAITTSSFIICELGVLLFEPGAAIVLLCEVALLKTT